MKVLEGDADAIFGVACLDSLEKSFQRLVELGVPHMALPLLKDGCVDTEAEVDQIRDLLTRGGRTARWRRRAATSLCCARRRGCSSRRCLPNCWPPIVESAELASQPDGRLGLGGGHCLDWLQRRRQTTAPLRDDCRLRRRPARPGRSGLRRATSSERIPLPIRRLALAIEALHKASLVHDDIEDDDEFRYGRPTLHRMHGVGQAVNMGDYLIGLGYRLIAGEMASLGTDCSSDILNRLSHAHLELCRGQGAELQLAGSARGIAATGGRDDGLCPEDRARLRGGALCRPACRRASDRTPTCSAASRPISAKDFKSATTWTTGRQDDRNKRNRGLDALAGRPTILRVFAAGSRLRRRALAELAGSNGRLAPADLVERVPRALLPLRRVRQGRAVVAEIAGPRPRHGRRVSYRRSSGADAVPGADGSAGIDPSRRRRPHEPVSVSRHAGRDARAPAWRGLSTAFVDAQVRFVAGCQQPDGGFRGRQGGSDPYYTDFALRTLALLAPGHRAFDRAAHWPRPADSARLQHRGMLQSAEYPADVGTPRDRRCKERFAAAARRMVRRQRAASQASLARRRVGAFRRRRPDQRLPHVSGRLVLPDAGRRLSRRDGRRSAPSRP